MAFYVGSVIVRNDMNDKTTIEKTLLQSSRLRIVFEADVTPIVKVLDDTIQTLDILTRTGLSRSEARRLIKQSSVKIESEHGEKEILGDTIPDEHFVLFRSNDSMYSGVFVWVGKKKAVLAYTHVSTYKDELIESDSWNEPRKWTVWGRVKLWLSK